MSILIPKIIFKYSSIYDLHWQKWINFKYGNINKYPNAQYINSYINKIDKIWNNDEKNILEELNKITNLKWSTKVINCYIVGRCIPISDPLTMQPHPKEDRFIDILIHELIHQLFIQRVNIKSMKKVWKYFEEEYKNETKKTIIHIPLHAMHKYIYLKFYSEEGLKRDIEFSNDFPEYKKAWDVVEEKGYKNIIKELKNHTLRLTK